MKTATTIFTFLSAVATLASANSHGHGAHQAMHKRYMPRPGPAMQHFANAPAKRDYYPAAPVAPMMERRDAVTQMVTVTQEVIAVVNVTATIIVDQYGNVISKSEQTSPPEIKTVPASPTSTPPSSPPAVLNTPKPEKAAPPVVSPSPSPSPPSTPPAAPPATTSPIQAQFNQQPTPSPSSSAAPSPPPAVVAAPPPPVVAQPQPSPSPSPSPQPASSQPSGNKFTGELTYYAPGMGSCGLTSGGSENVVAIAHEYMETFEKGNPNANTKCGKTITISYGGKTTTATVVDKCGGCKGKDIDVSEPVFTHFQPLGVGRFTVDWWWN